MQNAGGEKEHCAPGATLILDAPFTNVMLVKVVIMDGLSSYQISCTLVCGMEEDLFPCGLSAVAEMSLYMVSFLLHYQNMNSVLMSHLIEQLNNLILKTSYD